jgi:hypothetical protein
VSKEFYGLSVKLVYQNLLIPHGHKPKGLSVKVEEKNVKDAINTRSLSVTFISLYRGWEKPNKEPRIIAKGQAS